MHYGKKLGICSAFTAAFSIGLVGTGVSRGSTVYDAASDYEAGWASATNPNGVWSYGYSTSATAPVTLYDTATTSGLNGGNEQFWWSSAVSYSGAPSVALNNGPAYDDGNTDFLADELVLCDGFGGQYSVVAFTAPSAGVYSVDSSFRGDQYGVGTAVGVAVDGSILFSSSVTSEGQVVPFSSDISLNAGDTVDFYVGPDGGEQNTGFSATITSAVPAPATFSSGAALLAGLGLTRRRKASRTVPKDQKSPVEN